MVYRMIEYRHLKACMAECQIVYRGMSRCARGEKGRTMVACKS